jgi:hypothetical protein
MSAISSNGSKAPNSVDAAVPRIKGGFSPFRSELLIAFSDYILRIYYSKKLTARRRYREKDIVAPGKYGQRVKARAACCVTGERVNLG